MQTIQKIEPRPFREEDRVPINDIINHGVPPHRIFPVAGWKSYDAMRLANAAVLRLSVGDPAYAYLEVVDLNTTAWKLEDVCEIDIVVAPERRRQGIGSALYEQGEAFARSRGAKRLICEFFAWTPDEPALAFLQSKGFEEQEREQAAYLDLATFDVLAFEPALQRATQSGVTIMTYAQAGDTDDNRRRLYALSTAIHHEVPRRDEQPLTPMGFDDWSQRWFQRPEYTPSLIRLAEVDGEWVGLTVVAPKQGLTTAMQWITGVLPAYQGRGIATALKVDSYRAAREQGITVITTENHELNGPMLAINTKFGFLPDAPLLVYNKGLIKEQTHAGGTETCGSDVLRRRPRANLAIVNKDLPSHRCETAASWKSYEATRTAGAVSLRLVIGNPAVALMKVVDRNTTSRKLSDVCELELVVAHEHRRRGLGTALYEKALEFAHGRGAKRITTEFFSWTENEPAIAFHERRGFSEMERLQTSYLDLTAFDPDLFAGSEERTRAVGIRFFSYADVGGETEENRRNFYEMFVPIIQAVPQRDDQPVIVESFDVWNARPRLPEANPALLWIAACGSEWIGYTRIMPRPASTSAMQWLTGVLAPYQGKGVATVLKAKAYQAAQARGFTVITTENHEMNAPMLAINKKFGFLPDAPLLVYNKVLEEEAVYADRTKSGGG